MSKVAKRLLVFFLGVPFILALVIVNVDYHLPLHILLGFISVLGAKELYEMINDKSVLFPKVIVLVFSMLLPFITYIFILFNINLEIVPWIFVFEVIIIMAIECFTAKTFENSLKKIVNTVFIIFYCGFLPTFISRMASFENSTYYISLFLIFVFMCDSCAWFFGILFGKNNRGIIACSPNKSVIGFIGGVAGSIVFGLLFKILFPQIITGSYIRLIILGFLTAIAGIIGDLIESVIKRSCNCKDSGVIIPGRGGVLDSVDSIIVAAPVFYAGVHFLYNL